MQSSMPWTVQTEALDSISENFSSWQWTWDKTKKDMRDTEMKAQITGVASLTYSLELKLT